MFSYAILSYDGFSGCQLVSSHMDGFGAWTAYRRARPPCLLVRLDARTEVLILEAKGVDLCERPTDLRPEAPAALLQTRMSCRGAPTISFNRLIVGTICNPCGRHRRWLRLPGMWAALYCPLARSGQLNLTVIPPCRAVKPPVLRY